MFSYIQKLIDKVKKSEKGQGMVEYALIIAFVAAIAIFVLNGKLGNAINNSFDQAEQQVTKATTGATGWADGSSAKKTDTEEDG